MLGPKLRSFQNLLETSTSLKRTRVNEKKRPRVMGRPSEILACLSPRCLYVDALRAVFFFYATSLLSIPIKEEAWTIVHTASTLYKRYITGTARLPLMLWTCGGRERSLPPTLNAGTKIKVFPKFARDIYFIEKNKSL
jgi:hypothetical protein